MEMEKVPQWYELVKQGDVGNGMYFILQGELRARVMVDGKETILATFGPGDFFRRHVAVRSRSAVGGRDCQCGQHRAENVRRGF